LRLEPEVEAVLEDRTGHFGKANSSQAFGIELQPLTRTAKQRRKTE
jgi:hypothetical protein